MAFMSPSPIELMMIAVIALIVLGPSRLPEAARSLGRGMREMRNSFQHDDHDRFADDTSNPPDGDDEVDVDDDASLDELEDGDGEIRKPPAAEHGAPPTTS